MISSKLASLEARIARLESSLKPVQSRLASLDVPEAGDILILAYDLEMRNFTTGEPEINSFHFFFQVVSSNPKTGSLILVQKDEDEKGGGFVPGRRDITDPFKAKWTPKGVLIKYLSTIYYAHQWDGRPAK